MPVREFAEGLLDAALCYDMYVPAGRLAREQQKAVAGQGEPGGNFQSAYAAARKTARSAVQKVSAFARYDLRRRILAILYLT
jgi:hypothetical protein